jgi:hypothetical protein
MSLSLLFLHPSRRNVRKDIYQGIDFVREVRSICDSGKCSAVSLFTSYLDPTTALSYAAIKCFYAWRHFLERDIFWMCSKLCFVRYSNSLH